MAPEELRRKEEFFKNKEYRFPEDESKRPQKQMKKKAPIRDEEHISNNWWDLRDTAAELGVKVSEVVKAKEDLKTNKRAVIVESFRLKRQQEISAAIIYTTIDTNLTSSQEQFKKDVSLTPQGLQEKKDWLKDGANYFIDINKNNLNVHGKVTAIYEGRPDEVADLDIDKDSHVSKGTFGMDISNKIKECNNQASMTDGEWSYFVTPQVINSNSITAEVITVPNYEYTVDGGKTWLSSKHSGIVPLHDFYSAGSIGVRVKGADGTYNKPTPQLGFFPSIRKWFVNIYNRITNVTGL